MDLNTFLTTVNSHNWYVLLATIVVSGGGVSVLLQLIKHFGKLQEAQKTVMFLLSVLGAVGTVADQLLVYNGTNPKIFVGLFMGWVLTAAVFIHRFAVSPVYHTLVNWLTTVYANNQAYIKEHDAVVPAPSDFTLPQ